MIVRMLVEALGMGGASVGGLNFLNPDADRRTHLPALSEAKREALDKRVVEPVEEGHRFQIARDVAQKGMNYCAPTPLALMHCPRQGVTKVFRTPADSLSKCDLFWVETDSHGFERGVRGADIWSRKTRRLNSNRHVSFKSGSFKFRFGNVSQSSSRTSNPASRHQPMACCIPFSNCTFGS